MGFDPVAYLNEPRWQKVSLGLSRIQRLMELLEHPEAHLRCAHVAGTNGKGSTCACLDAICRSAGLKTGLFTSPYLTRFEERIRVDGKDIASEDLEACTLEVKRAAEEVQHETGEHPTEFELMFAVAALHFAQAGCEACIVEVGLGGRLDATNVITPCLSVITRIGLDHTALLGSTIDAIAAEKAGIVKPRVPCITCEQEPAAQDVLEGACRERRSPLSVVRSADITCARLTGKLTRTFIYQGEPFETKLLGAYQPENASLAIAAARQLASAGWPLSEKAIRQGVAQAVWPGRFQVLARHPLVIVDGAHNADGARALAASLDEVEKLLHPSETICVVGVLADKDARAILEPLAARAEAFFLYAPANPRALPAADLAHLASQLAPQVGAFVCTDAQEAMDRALKRAAPESMVAAFGSLYSIADVTSACEAVLGAC